MLDDFQGGSANDIAIIGMALRVPGARNVTEFWGNLRAGIESIRTLTPEQLIAAGATPEEIRQKNYVPCTADMPDMEMFDPDFFGFSPKEAAIMDPQHRHFLECAWEALEDGGRNPKNTDGPVGVFAGCGMGSYFYFNVCSHRDLVDQVGMFLLRHTGNDKDFMSTRLSHVLDLRGPSMNVQTACSTSLVATHYACQSLIMGESDMAIAGGVTIELPHRRGYIYQDGEILSPDGHCRAFDHRAAGTVFGSGVGVVVLRRLADAIADGDPIRAVIKATAVNNDGAAKAGYLAPSVTGQAEAIVEAHGLADISADTIDYVECHGTGTYLGDPIEIAALTNAFRQSTDQVGFCRIGSVKTNIGHLDTAAGVVSLIKAVLAVEHGELPPSLSYEAPNPSIDFETSPFIVNDRLTPWPQTQGPRRAGVNSLGVGGTNVHAVIEQAPSRPATQSDDGPQLLVVSGKSKKAAVAGLARLEDYLQANPNVCLDDVAHTLFQGRRHFENRCVFAVKDRADALAVLADPASLRVHNHSPLKAVSGAIFMMPGGGAQYPGMARALYASNQQFAEVVDEGLSHLPPHVAEDIRSLWLNASASDTEASKRFHQPSIQLPAILILEVALARFWITAGIEPEAIIGHSMGENSAACLAGVLTFERAVNLVHLRGELFDEIKGGAMLSVPLSVQALRARLPDGLDIATVNAPELCAVSGPVGEIERFQSALNAEDIDASRVPIDVAAHSRMLEPILERFRAFLTASDLMPPRIPIVSNLTGDWLTDAEAMSPDYWVHHLRTTVRFADGLAKLAEDQSRVFIEVGPGRMLSALAKSQPAINANQVINTLPHVNDTEDANTHVLGALGRAWALGLPIKPERINAGLRGSRIHLPTYAFQHAEYFLDALAPRATEGGQAALLKKPDIADWGWVPAWKRRYADTTANAHLTPKSFLLFLDDTGAGETLAEKLRSHGHKVMTVTVGDSFRRLDPHAFSVCPEDGLVGYVSLLREVAGEDDGALPDHIVHLWLLTENETFRPGSSFFHRNQERGFYSLLHLAQALADFELANELQISVVTNGMQRLFDEAVPYPEKATALGPAGVIPRELSNTFVRMIDVPCEASINNDHQDDVRASMKRLFSPFLPKSTDVPAPVADLIWDDMFSANSTEIVAYRNGCRWVHGYQSAPLVEGPDGVDGVLREGGVYLFTGGLGDLALALAEQLSKRIRARIVLLGRSELPDRRTWADYLKTYGNQDRIGSAISTMQRIEQAGGDVLYLIADVTNLEALSEAIQKTKDSFGQLDGVFHAAGVVRDELMQLKKVSSIEDVFAPKVFGTQVLDAALQPHDVDFVALFSSTSTATTPAGQVDYVAANAYLNAFAQSRAGRSGPRYLAINWGVWSEIGLAARAVSPNANDMSSTSVEPAKQPLFDRSVRDASGSTWAELRCSPDKHWILDEHRLKTGEPIWPGSGYLELIAEAASEYGLRLPMEIGDVSFLRPLHVGDGETRTLRARIEENGRTLRFAIESRPVASDGASWVCHAEGYASKSPPLAEPHVDLQAELAACTHIQHHPDDTALDAAQEIHLRFGPRWKTLREIHVGDRSALARLEISEKFLGDFEHGVLIHPALMDMATGFAMNLIKDYDPAVGLWAPMSYGRIRIMRPLPSTFWSLAKLSQTNDLGPGFATFDIRLLDEDGQVFAKIDCFTVRQLAANVDLAVTAEAASPGAKPTPSASGELPPALARLAAQVDQGIAPDEGLEAFVRALQNGQPEIIVSSMDLEALCAVTELTEEETAGTARFARPDLDGDYVAPSTPTEEQLAEFWRELLGIDQVGVHDSFFDLGGHSLVAVRLFRMIKNEFAIELPISILFEAPTIAQCAELVDAARGDDDEAQPAGSNNATSQPASTRFAHVVEMDRGRYPARTPLFICAGMFGNILNLRHLAMHIGVDRPVYGLQAGGLYGDQEPHETFEEMAKANLAEVRMVQPSGPYLLSGFSGGGLVAYEMAQQLKAAGEDVAIVIMLDTPYPEDPKLATAERAVIRLQDIKNQGPAFISNWVRSKIDFQREQHRKAQEAESSDIGHFNNAKIEAAFYRALGRYEGKSYDGPVLLLRPQLHVVYELSQGRKLNADRELVRSDNGWSPYVANLRTVEVIGDHDGMVLEPAVRVLASHMRSALSKAENSSPLIVKAAE